MYSVVLMVALTGGGDVPAGLFHHGCCGGCYGCFGGCFGGCYGCGGGKHGHHGCCGGCFGGGHHRGHGCCGGCFGGCGGCFGGCYGGCWGGCGGCYGGCCGGCGGGACFGGCVGGFGGVGGVISEPVVPGTVVPTAPISAKPADGKKSTMENAALATLIVIVPANARLSIDGEVTPSTLTERVFVSPALEAGREYPYTLKAEFVKDGKPVTITKEVTLQAGNETRVRFDADNLAGVASR